MKENSFKLVRNIYMDKLKMYVLIVDCVYGKLYFEFYEVRCVFDVFNDKFN